MIKSGLNVSICACQSVRLDGRYFEVIACIKSVRVVDIYRYHRQLYGLGHVMLFFYGIFICGNMNKHNSRL
jgi:hypothetical protein